MNFPCQEQRNPLVLANGGNFALIWGASGCVITEMYNRKEQQLTGRTVRYRARAECIYP